MPESPVAMVMADHKNELGEAQSVENKWNAMKEVWLKAGDEVCRWVHKRTTKTQ